MSGRSETIASVTHVCDHGSSSEWCPKCFPTDLQTTVKAVSMMPTNALWRVARAMHHADEPPLCDWTELPHEDTSYGLGKATRLRHARAAMTEIGQIILWDAANG